MKKKSWKSIMAILTVGAVIPFTVSCGRDEGGENVNTENTETVISEDDNSEPENQEANEPEAGHEGYTLVWEEQFDGDSLNREDWNVELHDPGWVNEELQAYVDSTDNIYIEDGDLVLKPIETVNED